MKKKEEKTDMSEFTLIVGKRIRKARKAKDLTLEELAECCGLHPAYIGQLERGVKNASLYTLEKIACALELSLTDLVGNSDIVTETAKPISLLTVEVSSVHSRHNHMSLFMHC